MRRSGAGPSRFAVVPAAYVYLMRGRSVLLLRRAGTGFMDGHWAGAAGHVEYGESAEAAAIREAQEETGVTVHDLRPLCAVHRRHSPEAIDQRVDFFFSCVRWSREPRLLETDKADAMEWFDLAALPSPVVPHERLVLDHLARGSVPPVLTFGF